MFEQRTAVLLPRFGVEEEFLVVDPRTREVVPHAAVVVGRARERLGSRVGGEITKLQVETRTHPCRSTAELFAQLTETRSELQAAATTADLRVVASGSPLLAGPVPPPITEGPRQELGTATFRALHDGVAICALHVHVEVPDRNRAVLIGNHLRAYLPTLIALTANSPFWAQRDTGYASWRTITWAPWPVAGPPPHFSSADDYDARVAELIEAGALVDRGTIFWDIRVSASHPTLEIRACDVPVTAIESAALAALVRALVATAGVAVDGGDPGPDIRPELLRTAYWRAARDGMAGHGVDLRTGGLVPAGELAQRLLRHLRPALEAGGDLERVRRWLAGLAAHGDGATRQRAAAGRRGRLTDVVDDLIAQTAPQPVPGPGRTESNRA